MSEPADCIHCGHPKGAHQAGGDGDLAFAVKGCDCSGYVARGGAGE
jgi:hypothetical protein